jgi:hypothetical protein
MDRLTRRNELGLAELVEWEGTERMDEGNIEAVANVADLVCAYEETGLTPAEVEAMKAENARLAAELGAATKDLQMAGRGNACEVCAHDKEGLHNPNCDACGDEPGTSRFEWRGVPATTPAQEQGCPFDEPMGGGEG